MMTIKRTQFNVIVYIVCVLLLPVLGIAIEGALGIEEASLSLLFFIAAPIGVAILLRTVGKDGWETSGLPFRFQKSGWWYGWSIGASVLGVGLSLLFVSLFAKASDVRLGSIGSSAVVTFLLVLSFQFIKNIAEEFGWRGYLMPQLDSLGIADWVNILIVGFFWGAWHMPPILYTQASREIITTYSGNNMVLFVVLFFAGVLLLSISHHWIRKASGTVWTNVLFHSVTNAIFGVLITQAVVNPSSAEFFTGSIDPGTVPGIAAWGIVAAVTWFLAWRFGRSNEEFAGE